VRGICTRQQGLLFAMVWAALICSKES